MEKDPPSMEKFDEMKWTSDNHGATQVRSYECTFCKRGFSNAQALGGHMNIHRKDRAKLKQTTGDGLLSSDITTKNSSIPPVSTDNTPLQLESSEEKGSTLNWTRILSRGDDVSSREETHAGEFHQLPLFAEMPSAIKDLNSISRAGRLEEGTKQLSHGSPRVELDLELRLGPEPQDISTKATKELL
ncbi:hypothetical protein HHK36_018448 [Tetracentron sinense]|uniref:C2H2-type domain-containing protein n=1 Tax=Tetracentron sinense TaxID=13715 RepID=A0A834YYI6_TETSI|nr:hypothetical protein HHK36_032996 [Tetracentron sinense]KAF8396815.1 hypothetical protein HHK36_018448 [Tetracentron sinense]